VSEKKRRSGRAKAPTFKSYSWDGYEYEREQIKEQWKTQGNDNKLALIGVDFQVRKITHSIVRASGELLMRIPKTANRLFLRVAEAQGYLDLEEGRFYQKNCIEGKLGKERFIPRLKEAEFEAIIQKDEPGQEVYPIGSWFPRCSLTNGKLNNILQSDKPHYTEIWIEEDYGETIIIAIGAWWSSGRNRQEYIGYSVMMTEMEYISNHLSLRSARERVRKLSKL
jgi:hypothetical protein